MLWLQVGRATQCGWFQTGAMTSGGQGHNVGGSNTTQVLWLQVSRATQCGWFHTGPWASGEQGHTLWVVPDRSYVIRW